KSLHEQAQHLLAPECRECFKKIEAVEVGAVGDWEECRERWKNIETQDSVFYVYGHSDGTGIELDPQVNDEYKMEAVRFHRAFQKTDAGSHSATIFILNGCLTGRGEAHNGFLRTTAMPGFYGFIGTEAEVPNKFASEYGTDFMDSLCFWGRSVQETYDDLQVRHFPLSLLYSCFAHPDYRVEPPPQVCHTVTSPAAALHVH